MLTPQQAAAEYLAKGLALVPIPAGLKGPVDPGWNRKSAAVTRPDQITGNVGLAHAYSGTAVIDFDKLDVATEWLRTRGVDVSALWTADDAVRISSGRANRGKLLFRLPDGVEPLASKMLHKEGLELRCATRDGLTVQDVLPPSIHPETGKPYAWEYADDLIGHWSCPPVLPANVLALWRTLIARPELDDTPQDKSRLGLTEGQVRHALTYIDPDCGYETWINALMAVHHEAAGQPWGLDLVDEWSATATGKYAGRGVIESKWDGFGKDRQSVVTARWLMSQANVAGPDEFADLQKPTTTESTSRFSVQTAGEFAKGEPPQWLIKGVLPKTGLAVVYGESGSGKSFFVLDMVASMARGEPWRECRTKKSRGIYIAAEGAGGMRNRLHVYAEHARINLTDLDIGIIGDVPNLLLAKDTRDLLTAIDSFGQVGWIVVDTWAQVTPGGNENSAEDMGKALAHVRAIHQHTGALVILVHHSGKDASKGARGWSGMKAAADAELEITRHNEDRLATVTKLKDGQDGALFGFKLNTVTLGYDEDGDPITSCAVRTTVNTRPLRGPRGKLEKLTYNIALEMLNLSDVGHIAIDDVLTEVASRLPIDDTDKHGRDRRKEHAKRALISLQEADFLILKAGGVLRPEPKKRK